MFKTFSVALLSASYVSAQSPSFPNCGAVQGFVNGLNACGCTDSEAVPVIGQSVCECLDQSVEWTPNGSNCSLGTAKKSAYVNALRTRYEAFNNAASRAAADRGKATTVTNNNLSAAKAAYEAQKDAFWSWFPYRKTWSENHWFYRGRWWAVTAQWVDWSQWANYRQRVLDIKQHNWARQDFIDEREKIEAKHEATPFTNQLDLIVGSLGDRPGAGFVPTSTWASASQSNQLGRGPMGAVEARDPQLAYQFNNQWASLDNSVDDDQSWASATQSNEFGRTSMGATEALYSEGNNMEFGLNQQRFTMP